ncbi:hypothetical protein [Labrenzia sp. PHM005]|uniref:hypothetical protein n=1 Tax=Labrenzia sp. PHM005 TaxID=2590016 RepID=UPI0011406B17|nr:hypothetical protein [Labrenzia sp. PHM005]QDG75240.1 hypothetical protein FJ695_04820 [Labrenzia sp. PHM005]
MNVFFGVAAFLSAAVFLIHTFLGGRTIAVPLLKAQDLHPVPKLTSYYCWHIVTITLAIVSGMFVYAAYSQSGTDLGWAATLLTLGYCLLGLWVPVAKSQTYKNMPQGWLFLPIVIMGVLGGST